MLKRWDDLPDFMRIQEVRPYWKALDKKRAQLKIKRIFDFIVAIILLLILAVPMIIISLLIKRDSEGPIFFRQERVTIYGRKFKIHKFRTMVTNADKLGSAVTVENDSRITKVGAKLRRYRIDELPQLIDVIEGTMSFVGVRPEAVKYVEQYDPEYYATLLMPAGITSEASIRFKDEDTLLHGASDVDNEYITHVLPEKMKWNLKSIKGFNIFRDINTMIRTIFAVFGKDYNNE